jgi:hypothetical protein
VCFAGGATQGSFGELVASDTPTLRVYDVERRAQHQSRLSRKVRVVLTVLSDHVPVTPDSMISCDAEVQVVVFGSGNGCLEPSEMAHDGGCCLAEEPHVQQAGARSPRMSARLCRPPVFTTVGPDHIPVHVFDLRAPR